MLPFFHHLIVLPIRLEELLDIGVAILVDDHFNAAPSLQFSASWLPIWLHRRVSGLFSRLLLYLST